VTSGLTVGWLREEILFGAPEIPRHPTHAVPEGNHQLIEAHARRSFSSSERPNTFGSTRALKRRPDQMDISKLPNAGRNYDDHACLMHVGPTVAVEIVDE